MRNLTIKQRRFLKHYVETGNGTQAALVAYQTDPNTARSMAAENLAKPSLKHAVAELLDAQGLSDRRLFEIHARYLALYRSDDPREKALGLKALDMAYRVSGKYVTPEPMDSDRLFDGWTTEELAHFVETSKWPARFRRPAGRPAVALGRAIQAAHVAPVIDNE